MIPYTLHFNSVMYIVTTCLGTDCDIDCTSLGAALVPNPRDNRSAHVPARKQQYILYCSYMYILHVHVYCSYMYMCMCTNIHVLTENQVKV